MANCRNCGKITPKEPGKRSSKYYCDERCHILNKINIQDNGCWNSTCVKKSDGYHHIGISGNVELTHRASWKAFNGDIPEDKIICHKCDNRSCCNPDHLYLGTHSTNALDRQKRNSNADQTGSRNHNSKIDEYKARYIKFMANQGFNLRELADFFGLKYSHVVGIKTGRIWKHI